MTIKKFFFVEANDMNISAKLQLYPPYFYAPNFEEVEGAYWFGHVSGSVHACVTLAYSQERLEIGS